MFSWFRNEKLIIDLKYELADREDKLANLQKRLEENVEASLKGTQDDVAINWSALNAVFIERRATHDKKPYTAVRYMAQDGLRSLELSVSDRRHKELVEQFDKFLAERTPHYGAH